MTTLAEAARPATDRRQTIDSAPGGMSRVMLTALAVAAALAIPLLGLTGFWVAASIGFGSLAWAVALTPRSPLSPGVLPALSRLGLAAVVLVFLSTALALLSTATGLDLWSSRAGSVVGWALLLAGAVIVAWIRRGRVTLAAGDRAAAVTLSGVLGVLVTIAVLVPMEVFVRLTGSGTDFTRHVVVLRGLGVDGGLDYSGTQYPRGFHSLVGLVNTSSGAESFTDAWLAMEWTVLLIVALTAAALVSAAGNTARQFGLPRAVSTVAVPLTVAAVYLTGAWMSRTLLEGYVTSIAAGLVLVVVAAAATQPRWLGSPGSIALTAVSLAVLSHTWTLFVPLVGLLFLTAVVVAFRQRMDEYRPDVRMGLYLVVFPAAAVGLAAVLPLLQYFGTQVDEAVSIPGGTRLPGANPFWWVAFGLTVLAVTVAWRRGLHGLAASAIILVGFGLVLVAGLVIASGATWTDMGYYPTKTLATVALVATPFAVAGGAWALHRAFLALLRRRGHSTVLVAALSVAVLAAGVSLVAVAAERQPLVIADWIDDGPRRVPYGLPVLTELKARGVTTEVPGEPVIALGVAPYDSETAWLGDWNSMDATGWLGHGSDPTGDVVNAVVRGTASDICETLADHPGAPRITGPTDASGIEPLLDSGCPEAIVRPDDWIRVTIPDEWFALLPQQGQPYDTEFPEAWGER